MAPTKNTRAAAVVASKQMLAPAVPLNGLMPALARKGLARRATQIIQDQNAGGGDMMQTRGKRKAEHSPSHGNKNEKIKRSALGNLTNNVKALTMQDDHQLVKKVFGQQSSVFKDTRNTVGAVWEATAAARQNTNNQNKITTRATARNANNILQQQTKIILDDKTSKVLANAGTTAATAAAVVKAKREEAKAPLPPPAAPVSSAAAQSKVLPTHKPMRRISNEFNKSGEDSSLYMSALEDVSSSDSMLRLSGNFEAAKRRSTLLQEKKSKTDEVAGQKPLVVNADSTTSSAGTGSDEFAVSVSKVPHDVEDFDQANWNDPFQVSHYAAEIFQYLKQREDEFPIRDYMMSQIHLSKSMRSLLVDWMVEVQETFELNHETLYLAVKIVDLYLCEVVINKERLQLLGAAALFIACKYDERTPPLIEDFLYICDGAYTHVELVRMEMQTLRTINFDLGIPLSYRFLRRYARCAKIPMPTLTLARYILEMSLMDYATVRFSDSQMASAALFMALRMHGDPKPWTPTLQHYSGYALADFAAIVPVLNAGLSRKTKGNNTIKTIRSKYSHKIFHEVAKVPLLDNEQLFENNLDLSDCDKMEVDENEKPNGAKVAAGAASATATIVTSV